MIATNSYEIPEGVRGVAQTGLDQSRRAFDTYFAAIRRNAEMVQGASALARSAALEMAARGFDYAEANVHASLDCAQRLARTRDVKEAMEIQAAFVRERFDAFQGQAKEIGRLAQSTAQQGAEQAKAGVEETRQQAAVITDQGREAAEQTAQAVTDAASEAKDEIKDAVTH